MKRWLYFDFKKFISFFGAWGFFLGGIIKLAAGQEVRAFLCWVITVLFLIYREMKEEK